MMFSDVDLDSITPLCPATCGNLTLMLVFSRPNSGAFRFFPLVPTLQLDEYTDSQQRRTLVIWGKLRDINALMDNIYFDVDDDYTGYAPVEVFANDMINYGMQHSADYTNHRENLCVRAETSS